MFGTRPFFDKQRLESYIFEGCGRWTMEAIFPCSQLNFLSGEKIEKIRKTKRIVQPAGLP